MTDKKTEVPKRYVVTVYLTDHDKENPVVDATSIGCPDQRSSELMYEIIQRILQSLTYRPNNG